MAIRLFFITLPLLLSTFLQAQVTKVTGVVTDGEFQQTLPFVSIQFKGTNIRSLSDMDGKFAIETSENVDSLEFSFVGYEKKVIKVKNGKTITGLRIELKPEINELKEAIIEKKENPAYGVLRNVVKNKDKNDMFKLDAYEYDVYSKVQVDADNISEQLEKIRVTRKIKEDIEELKPVIDEDGNEVVTIFFSESISRTYHRNKPSLQKDIVKSSRVRGLGISDGSLTSQFVGSSMILVNMYENSITILDKEFISPITNNWKSYYKYGIDDTVTIDGIDCIEMRVTPKRAQDLAFKGKIWIALSDSSYALKKVNLEIPKEANINFIEKIRVNMEWQPTEEGPWMFKYTKYVFNVDEVSKRLAGIIVRSTSHYENHKLNTPQDKKFYEQQIELGDDIQIDDDTYWEEHRFAKLDSNESQSLAMVDSVIKLPIVNSFLDILNFFVNGYFNLDKIRIGPYISSYAYNEIEGNRFTLGIKTSPSLSKKFIFQGYLAYGTLDDKFKYGLNLKLIPDKSPWTEIKLRSYKDIDLLGFTDQISSSPVISVFAKWGNQIGAYWNHENSISYFRQVNNSFSHELTYKNRYLAPLFDFGYYDGRSDESTSSTFSTSEVSLKLRYARNEKFVINDNYRMSLGTGTVPIISIFYTAGLEDVFGSDFTYHKLDMMVNGKIGMGGMGRFKYLFQTGKTFGNIPYLLLTPHLGNESVFYIGTGFNLMNYYEFVSDQYVSLILNQHFDGYFMNRIPFAKKAKLRLLVSLHTVYGSISDENINILPGEENPVTFETFGNTLYVEVGYGIENIFKVGRVQFFNRINHLDNPNIQKFGIKGMFHFSL